MSYQPLACYDLLPDATTNSRYSRPRHEHPDGSYEIHLVKADDPGYIPGDIELWPIFHSRILQAIRPFPDATRAAHDAYLQVLKDHTGRKNRDVPRTY
jgi:hypothetical protein